MISSSFKFLFLMSTLVFLSSWANSSPPSFNQQVQAPTLETPKRGSIAGELASFAQDGADLMKGSMNLALPLSFPQDRGRLIYPIIPKYRITQGVSEWGIGFDASVKISRYRRQGPLQYTDDEFISPWGTLIKGTDGYFYPEGLQSFVRLAHPNEQVWIAYLENGDILTFGGERAKVETPKGTYAWYLTSAESVIHEKTLYTYFDTDKTGERPVLEFIRYGGHGDAYQYEIQFHSSFLSNPVFDYLSGERITLTRKIDKISFSARKNGQLNERYSFQFRYRNSESGPGFYLVEMKKVFSSGVEEPPFQLDYYFSEELWSKAQWKPVDQIRPILTLEPNALTPELHSVIDLNEDGQSQIELAKSYQRILIKDGNFEIVPLASNDAEKIDPFCRPSKDVTPHLPRIHTHLKGRLKGTDIVGFQYHETRGQTLFETIIHICDLEGHLKEKLAIPNFDLRLGTHTQLVDLSQKGKPDLVWIGSGSGRNADNPMGSEIRIFVFENISTDDEYAFNPVPREIRLYGFLNREKYIPMFQDINGDGILDFVLIENTGISVWYGKGGFEFEKKFAHIPFRIGMTNAVNLYGNRIHFQDLNGDGLPEALIQSERGSSIFFNQGNAFVMKIHSPLSMRSWARYSGKPIVLDLLGNGNTQIVAQDLSRGTVYDIEVSEPGTSLLRKANDGKGNEVEFTYKRMVPTQGLQYRFPVIDRTKLTVSGSGSKLEQYNFSDLNFHTIDKGFLGFSTIQKQSEVEKILYRFQYGDQQPGILLSKEERDLRQPSLFRILKNEYQKATVFGLEWERLAKTEEGFSGDSREIAASQSTLFNYHPERVNCPQQVTTINTHGQVVYDIKNSDSPGLGLSLHCLLERFAAYGSHQKSRRELDFTESIEVLRNSFGQPTQISRLGSSPKVVQTIEYNSEQKIQAIFVPGKGKTEFTYDPDTTLLSTLTHPDGVVSSVQRDLLSDQIRQMKEERGGSQDYFQFFDYDSWDRLKKSWVMLGNSGLSLSETEWNYRYPTITTPGWIETLKKMGHPNQPITQKELSFFTGSEEQVGTLVDFGSQSTLTQINSFDLATKITRHHTQKNLDYKSNIEDPNYSVFYEDVRTLSENVKSIFDLDLREAELYQKGIIGAKNSEYEIDSEQVIRKMTENQSIIWKSGTDFQGKSTFFETPEGRKYHYSYDALGRLAEIYLPSGEKHQVFYNDLGEMIRIRRSGLGTIALSYQKESELLEKKEFFDEKNTLVRSVHWLYDAQGRKTEVRYRDAQSGEEIVYHYFYDGRAPHGELIEGQRGRLTAITGPAFQKIFRYRADGKVIEEKIIFKDFTTLVTQTDYRIDGSVQTHHYVRTSPKGQLLLDLSLSYELDLYGREAQVRLGKDLLYQLEYDSLSRVSKVTGPHLNLSFHFDAETQAEKGYIQNWSDTHHVGVFWNKNARGLIESQDYFTASRSVKTNYGYTDAGFLSSFMGDQETIQYTYNDRDQVSRVAKDKDVFNIPNLVTNSLGQVTQNSVRGQNLYFTYNPQGRVQQVIQFPKAEINYYYDDSGKRILKMRGAKVEEAYSGRLVLTDEATYIPIVIQGKTFAYLENKTVKAISPNLIDSIVSDDGQDLHLPEPYGERDPNHWNSAHSSLIDYAVIGYDRDMQAYRAEQRDYDPKLKRFLTPDPLFWENPEKCIESPFECNLYSYAKGNPISFVDPTGKSGENIHELFSKEAFGLNSIANGFEGWKDTVVKMFDNVWGNAYKTIGEFASIPGTPVSINSGIRLVTGQEPWSWSASNPGHSTTLTQGEYSKELGTTIVFGGAGQALHFLEHGPVAAHNTIEAFGKTFTEAQAWGKMGDALQSTLNAFTGFDVIGNIQQSNSVGF